MLSNFSWSGFCFEIGQALNPNDTSSLLNVYLSAFFLTVWTKSSQTLFPAFLNFFTCGGGLWLGGGYFPPVIFSPHRLISPLQASHFWAYWLGVKRILVTFFLFSKYWRIFLQVLSVCLFFCFVNQFSSTRWHCTPNKASSKNRGLARLLSWISHK